MKRILIDVQRALKGRTLNLSNEKLLQNNIAEAFSLANLDYKKEVKIDDKNTIDFMIDTLAIEIKITSNVSKMSIYRQVERYAKSHKVDAILLMTSKTMTLPKDINNKPIYVLSLGRTQL